MAVYTLDDSNTANTPYTGIFNLGVGTTTQEVAQMFVPNYSAHLTKITLKLAQVGAIVGGSVYVKLYSDNGGTPNTQLDNSGGIVPSTISSSATNYAFTGFTYALVRGTKYWLSAVANFTLSNQNYLNVYCSNTTYRADSKVYSPWAVDVAGFSAYFLQYSDFQGGGSFLFNLL